jgi:hypothetical protein
MCRVAYKVKPAFSAASRPGIYSHNGQQPGAGNAATKSLHTPPAPLFACYDLGTHTKEGAYAPLNDPRQAEEDLMAANPDLRGGKARIAVGFAFILGCLWLAQLGAVHAEPGKASEAPSLYAQFVDPPREYSVTPYWWWNGKLEGAELARQIDDMVAHKVYSCIMFPFMGLETPYLSDAWFEALGTALAEARKQNFTLNFDDEYEWPNGAARDIWSPWSEDAQFLQSRTLKENLDYAMKSLAYVEKDGWGGKPLQIDHVPNSNLRLAVASRWDYAEWQPTQDFFTAETYGKVPLDKPELDPASLLDVSSCLKADSFAWTPPGPGRWKVMVFYVVQSSSQGQYVDVLSDEAMHAFLRLVYGEYYKRFPSYFGSTIKFIVSDGEGSYGKAIAWTPKLFATFQSRHGYDLRKFLPLLVYPGGTESEKVRCDYMDTVTQLYAQNNAGLITDWCERRGVGHISSLWEDHLHEAEYQGSLMEVMRHASFPETDGLWDRGRDPRDYKESGSVAHFKGTRYAVENSALLGGESYLSPEKIRVDTNGFAAWGLNLFIPHAFDYDRQKITYYPSWFYQQPWWKYFGLYADYVRRISYMNSEGRHIAPVVIFNPVESVWAGMAPVFDARQMVQSDNWDNQVDVIDRDYADLIRQLTAHQIDSDVTDSFYLQQAGIEGSQLTEGNEAFRVLVLPPTPTLPLASMKKIEQFYDAGGTVFAMRSLPNNSVERGKGDPEIQQAARRIFGPVDLTSQYTLKTNSRGGKAYFVRDSVPVLVKLVEECIPLDVKVLEGGGAHFYVLHRQKLGQDFYWVVNDSEEPRRLTVQFSANGVPERWDALTGGRSPLFYRHTPSETEVALSFGPWDAFYVVFKAGEQPAQTAQVVRSDFQNIAVLSQGAGAIQLLAAGPVTGSDYQVELRDGQHAYRGEFHLKGELPTPLHLNGLWDFRPDARTIPLFYAPTRLDTEGKGESAGWPNPEFSANDWQQQWLSPENFTIRQWYAIGPFPNVWGKGFNYVFPPETERNLQSAYQVSGLEEGGLNWDNWIYGSTGKELRWQFYDSPDYFVELHRLISGGIRASGWAPSFGPVAYAFTYVYSPDRRPAQIRVTAKNVKVWVNGDKVISRYTDLYYLDMREYWGVKGDCILHPGWNAVLVKISGNLKFMFRIAKPDGSIMPDIIDSPTRSLSSAAATGPSKTGKRWYRLEVPPGAVGMNHLDLPASSRVFFNGRPLSTQGSEWHFPPLRASGNMVAVEVPVNYRLTAPVDFLSGTTPFLAAVWARTALRFYSGSARYERQVTLPPSYFGENKRIILDCGKVGVVADAWVNNMFVGTKIWEPYRFDITSFARPGTNDLSIVVTNTMSNGTDVGERFPLLHNIDIDGLVGPVTINPELQVELNCDRR